MRKIKSNRKTLRIKIITPMLSHGVKEAEIRIPEFKAAMRFWWRAMGTFDNVKDMRENEGKIFGDSLNIDNKQHHASPIRMRPCYNLQLQTSLFPVYISDKYKPKFSGICENEEFEIEIYKKLKKGMSLEYYVNLMELISLLGGIGQRTRRGYGCFCIESKTTGSIEDREDVFDYIKDKIKNLNIEEHYVFNKSSCFIERKESKMMKIKYPYLREIFIGAKCSSDEFFEKIKKAIDEVKKRGLKYKKDKKMLASPLYVTCFSNNSEEVFPIVCFLNNAEYKKVSKDYNEYIGVFRSEVLCQ